jgi:hypothetical protein
LLLIRMNAAETRASSAIALWTELTVVSRSRTTAAIYTFINDVSTTSTNIAAANTSDNRKFPAASWVALIVGSPVDVRDRAFRTSLERLCGTPLERGARSGFRQSLVVAVDEDAVDDVHAQEEDGQ